MRPPTQHPPAAGAITAAESPFAAILMADNDRTWLRLVSWGDLLDAAGWCVALEGQHATAWLSPRARAEWEAGGTTSPNDWDEVVKWLSARPGATSRFAHTGVRIWRAGGLPSAALPNVHFTPREREISDWLRRGKTCPEVALIVGCAVRTVEKHVANIYRKTGASGRANLILASGRRASKP